MRRLGPCPIRRAGLRGLAIALLTTMPQPVGSAWGREPTTKPPKETHKLETLIDDLANRNARPRIVNLGVEDVPLFDRDYNWKEQARVLDAIDAVRKHATPEMWEVLLAHEKDS